MDSSEQHAVQELKLREMEVKQQEHLATAGRYARGGPIYKYKIGSDGRRYAVGGEVQIDTSPIPDDPEATIEKVRTIKKTALAPAQPSSQDYHVAAQANQFALILDLTNLWC